MVLLHSERFCYISEKRNYMKKLSVILIILMTILGSCNLGVKQAREVGTSDDPNAAEVLEVINGSSYTYLRVEKNGEELWIATDLFGFEEGNVIYFESGLEMKDFESKELGRTFETIYFVDAINNEPGGMEDPHSGLDMGGQPQKPVLEKLDITIEPVEGSVSIQDIFANRNDYKAKMVKVHGQVTKVNSGIMGRNWVHIQDGTADGDNFDLTITTDDEPQVGDIVTYSGVLNLEVDFSYGYYYEVIVEDAVPLLHH
jgi:hypothetical protein